MADGQRGKLLAPASEKWIGADHERACPQLGQGRKDRIEIAFGARMQDMELAARGRGPPPARSLDRVSAAGLVGLTSRAMTVALGINSCISSSRFGPISTFKMLTPVRLPPGRFRLVTSPNSTGSNRYREDDRNRCGRRLCGQRRRSAIRDDHGHLAAHQIGRQRRQSIVLAVRPAVFDRDVLALDITGLFQAADGRPPRWLGSRRAPAVKEPDHRHRGCCARAAIG